MAELALFPIGSRWVLLDEDACQVGVYGSESEGLEAANEYVRATNEPRYLLVKDGEVKDGEWREALIMPPLPH